MDISLQIEAVYRRALLLRQYATESPAHPNSIDKALKELYFVLEELQTSEEELHHQNQALITTQHIAELERQRYQTLFDLAPDGYLVTDLQGKIYQANRVAAQLFAIPLEYLINKPLVVFIHELDRHLFQTRLVNLEQIQDWEIDLNPRNGVVTSLSIAVTQIQDPDRKGNMLLWSLHDITLRRQMAQQLQSAHDRLEKRVEERTAELSQTNVRLQQEMDERQQAEQKIREQAALIDIATDAIFVQDLDHRILFWNKGAERLYGWSAIDILGKKVDRLLYPDPSTQITTCFNLTIERGSWQDELEQVTQAGKTIIVASRWTLVREKSGQPQSILVVNTDITEKKQREAQFYRAQRMESLGTMASSIAHDLNNVFTPIVGLASMQLHSPQDLNENSNEYWEMVKLSAEHGIDLVQQILTFARGTEGKRTPLQIEYLLQEIVRSIEQTLPKQIEIRLDLPSQLLWLILANSTQIYQIIMNLCVNARDAIDDAGIITLSAENRYIDRTHAQRHLDAEAGNYLVISIADTGSGIPDLLLEQIFEPFFTTKEPGKGTGLGLSTTFNIAKNHGGFVEVESESGKGTQFQVYLPSIEESD